MNITLSDVNGDQVLIVPIVPPNIPILQPTKNTTFESLRGDINIIGIKGLREFGWDSFFPNQDYSFAKTGSCTNGWDYVDFLNNYIDLGLPIRLAVTTETKQTVLNMLASIDKFDYSLDAIGDIAYSIGFKEFNEQL